MGNSPALVTPEAYQFQDSLGQAVPTYSRPELYAFPDSLGQEAPLFDIANPDTDSSPPSLYLVTEPPTEKPLETSQVAFISADKVPELFAKRQAARQRAAEILARNSHKLHNGRAAEVPTAVDPLGTAKAVVRVKRRFGEHSEEFQEVFTGLVFDSGRLLGEAATKNTSEYFASKRQEFRGEDEGYYSHGLPISDMLVNGLSPTAEPEEQERRVNGEFVEEVGTYVPMGSIIADEGLRGLVERLPLPVEPELPQVSVEVTTISMCTDYAEEGHAINPKGSYGGYRPGMKGIAIRQMHFKEDETNSANREEEQVIISGIYITQDIIEDYMAEKGALEPGQRLTKTELLATQFISVNGGGLMGIVQELDEKAGAAHGINLFMGEEVPADHPKDYHEFMVEAEERRIRLEPMPTQLANFLVNLEERGVDSRRAEALVSNFLKDKLLAVAKKNPEIAEAMFDKATADGFREVARLEALGRYDEAWLRQKQVEEDAPEVSYCGSGANCGVEDIDPASPAGQMALRLGLKGKMVRNTKNTCKNCHAMSLYHDYHGNTACLGCGSTKLAGQAVKTPKPKAVSRHEKAGEVVPLRPMTSSIKQSAA